MSRDELDSIAHWLGSSAAEMHTQIDDLLEWLREAAKDDVDSGPRKVGAKKGSAVRFALAEFAKEIQKLFEEFGMRFGFQAAEWDVTKLMSPAARLLYEASRCLEEHSVDSADLKVAIEHADIKAAIIAAKRDRDFRDEFHGDPAVDALTE